jgi:hypothetical protein
MKNANTNNKPGFEITILKGYLMKCNYEDYIYALPPSARQHFNMSLNVNSMFDLSDYTPPTLSLNMQDFIEHSDIMYAINNPNWKYPCGNEPVPSLTLKSISFSKEIEMDDNDFICLQSFYAHHSSCLNFNPYAISQQIRPFYKLSIFGDTFSSAKSSFVIVLIGILIIYNEVLNSFFFLNRQHWRYVCERIVIR